MTYILHRYVLATLLCGLLLACNAPEKKKTVVGLYDLPAVGAPVDNDTYYTAPQTMRCSTINDLPSCNGT